MSYDIYLDINISQTSTQILENDKTIYFQPAFQDMMVIGINYSFSRKSVPAGDGIVPGQIDHTLNDGLYSFSLKTYQLFNFKSIDSTNNTQRKAKAKSLYTYSRQLTTDFVVLYINNFGGYPVEKNMLTQINNTFSPTKLTDSITTGSWFILIDNRSGKYKTITESVIALGDNINFYYLLFSKFSTINKNTWNKLFSYTHTEDVVKTTYETAFNDIDELLYLNTSDYVIILSRIHHNVVHIYRNNPPKHVT